MVTTSGQSRLAELARHSRRVILDNQASSGAYLAAPNFPVYRYGWLRDGAFIADAMSRMGEAASASAFLTWCSSLVEVRAPVIAALVSRREAGEEIGLDEFLHTRYTLDGAEADEEWWNHQLDGYGAWLWALGTHAGRGGLDADLTRFTAAVEATARYLVAFWAHPCYDSWEENGEQVHVSTLAAIVAGLRVAAAWPGIERQLADTAVAVIDRVGQRVRTHGVRDGHLVKWLGGAEIDANLLFCALPYGLLLPEDPLMRATVAAIKASGLAHDGGVHRHLADDYYGGGEWVLLAALLGSYFAAAGDLDEARAQLDWVVAQADADGQLPEQVSVHLLHPESLAGWVDRWGPIARPLLWSHAMFLNLYHDLRGG